MRKEDSMKVITFAGQPIVAVEDTLADDAFAYYAGLGARPDAFDDLVAEDFEFGMFDIPVAQSLAGLELVRVVHQLWIKDRPDEVTVELKPRAVLDRPARFYCPAYQAVPGQLVARAYGRNCQQVARALNLLVSA